MRVTAPGLAARSRIAIVLGEQSRNEHVRITSAVAARAAIHATPVEACLRKP